MITEVSERGSGRGAVDCFNAGKLTVRSDREGAVHTIQVEGELDLATAERLERELTRAEATDVLSIVLDLSGLTFIDSTGVRLLLLAHARSTSRVPSNPAGRRTRTTKMTASGTRIFRSWPMAST